jgi:hypothetical protein
MTGITDEATLVDVSVVSVSASSVDDSPDQAGQFNPVFSLRIGTDETNHRFRVLLGLESPMETGRFSVKVQATFTLPDTVDTLPPEPDLHQFAQTTAIPTLLPFLRSEVAGVTEKVLGAKLIIPVSIFANLIFDLAGETTNGTSDTATTHQ